MLFEVVEKITYKKQYINKNQFLIYGDGENNLQSYNSLVCKTYMNKKNQFTIILGRDYDYSKTTTKHLYLFLEEYTPLYFYNITNKRDYIKKLLKKCRENENEFYNENNYIIKYDEKMN